MPKLKFSFGQLDKENVEGSYVCPTLTLIVEMYT
jgi:hypothetical protein